MQNNMKRSFWNYLVSTPLHRTFLLVIVLRFIITMFVVNNARQALLAFLALSNLY